MTLSNDVHAGAQLDDPAPNASLTSIRDDRFGGKVPRKFSEGTRGQPRRQGSRGRKRDQGSLEEEGQ